LVWVKILLGFADDYGMATVKASVFADGMRGSLGNIALRQTRGGTQMLVRNIGRDARSPAQIVVRERMGQAARIWKNMTLEQATLWREYAKGLGGGGLKEAPVACNVFASLATRFLAVNPGGVVPLQPPVSPFFGDAVRVVLGSGNGVLTVQVLQGNSDGVVTEVLIQKLASVHRSTYLEKYRSKGFFDLNVGQMVSLPVSAGFYSVAIRVVEAGTGQSGAVVELGRVVVSG